MAGITRMLQYSDKRSRMRIHLLIMGVMFAVALGLMAGLLLVVHKYDENAAATYKARLGDRWDRTIQRWMERGFVHEGGMQFWDADFAKGNYPRSLPQPDKLAPDTVFPWRNATMSWLVPAYWIQSVYTAIGGQYSARLTSIYSQFIVALTAGLLGYLCALLAMHLRQARRHSIALGIAALAVFQTHPLNLMSYWGIQPLSLLLFLAIIFLLHAFWKARRDQPASRTQSSLQTALATLVIFSEPVTGALFITTFLVVQSVIAEHPPTAEDWVKTLVVPAILVVAYLIWQQAMVRSNYPNVVFVGSDIAFRMGMDGDSTYYRDMFDTWLRPISREPWLARLLDWHYLQVVALLSTALLLSRIRYYPDLKLPLCILLGAFGLYLPLAILFSQLIYIHAHYWNLCLLVPVCIATFCLAPAHLNQRANQSGIPVLGFLLVALFFAAYNARDFRVSFPALG